MNIKKGKKVKKNFKEKSILKYNVKKKKLKFTYSIFSKLFQISAFTVRKNEINVK